MLVIYYCCEVSSCSRRIAAVKTVKGVLGTVGKTFSVYSGVPIKSRFDHHCEMVSCNCSLVILSALWRLRISSIERISVLKNSASLTVAASIR